MVLPDMLKNGLDVVFCGTAPGNISARRGAYYAADSNKFWAVLHRTGLTLRLFAPCEYPLAFELGIGFTDVAKERFGVDSQLRKTDFDRQAFLRKILTFKPRVLCFTGKRSAQEAYGLKTSKDIVYGRQQKKIGETVVFVLPSPSAAAIRWWDESYWREAAGYIRGQA